MVVATATGDLLAAADGTPAWRRPAGAKLVGPLYPVGEFVFGAATDGTLRAFSAADGAPRWQAPGGPLLVPPLLHQGALLVATKDRRVVALDPADGKTHGEFTCPNWLSGVAWLPEAGLAAVAEPGGRVRFLSLPDLRVARELDLGARLLAGLTPWRGRPRWADSEEFEEARPLVVAADEDGLLYLLPVVPGKTAPPAR